MDILIIAAIWIVSGALAYGIGFAHTQRKYHNIAKSNYNEDRVLSAAYGALFGPIALIVLLVITRAKHGLKFK